MYALAWKGSGEALGARGYRVIAPDLRGRGLTERPAGGAADYVMPVAM